MIETLAVALGFMYLYKITHDYLLRRTMSKRYSCISRHSKSH